MDLDAEPRKKAIDERVRRELEMGSSIQHKFESMGAKRKSVIKAAGDLAELYYNATRIKNQVDSLMRAPVPELRRLADISVELQVTLGHTRNHISPARQGLWDFADFCYKRAPPEDSGAAST